MLILRVSIERLSQPVPHCECSACPHLCDKPHYEEAFKKQFILRKLWIQFQKQKKKTTKKTLGEQGKAKRAGRRNKQEGIQKLALLQVHFFITFDILWETELLCTLVASGSEAGGRYFKSCRTHTELYSTEKIQNWIDKIARLTWSWITSAKVVYFEAENCT